jgi:coupling of ubiquitin conjugation to ER degradation protein 1
MGRLMQLRRDNIRYDLLRTGNVELTSNKILEKGFLEAVSQAPAFHTILLFNYTLPQPPPAYFNLYPRTPQGPNAALPAGGGGGVAATATAIKNPQQSLISRYHLQDRVASLSASDAPISEEQIGGKAIWEDSPEKREASLKERKAQMILAARQFVVLFSLLLF